MAAFDRLFGDKPRIHLLAALLRLSPVTFTRAEWAEEAGVQKNSTNRLADDFEAEGFISKVSDGGHPEYEVNGSNPYFRILSALDAALELVQSSGTDSAIGEDASEAFRKKMLDTVLIAHNVHAPDANTLTKSERPGEDIIMVPQRRPGTRGYQSREQAGTVAMGGR